MTTAEPRPHVADGASEEEAIGTFEAFRYSSFRLLWVGNLFTAGAMWTQQLTVSWVVYLLTGSGTILGSVNLMRGVATLFFAMPAGSITDRLGRKKIIAWTQIAMAAVTLALAIDVIAGTVALWHIFLFVLLASIAQTFSMPAWQTFAFNLVPRRVVPNAIALSWLAFSIARAFGLIVGGSLFELLGPAVNFLLQVAAYVAVLAAVLMIRSGGAAPAPTRRPFFAGMADGWAFAVRDPRLRLLVLMGAISPMLIIPLHASLLPIFAAREFAGGGGTFGLLAGSIGVGGLLGGLLTASLNRIDRRGMMQLLSLLVFAFAETAFSILAHVTGNLWICVPFLILAGTFETVYTTTNTSVLQLLAPDHLRGSIASVLQFSFLLMPIGSFIAGAGADIFGAPAVGATMTFAAGIVGLAILASSSRMRDLRLSHLVRESQERSDAAAAAG